MSDTEDITATILRMNNDGSEKREILNALQDFERRTCIRFVTRTRQRAYLSFEPRNGCASLLGTVGDKQVVSLQRSGCIQRGIIQHEVLHALGFYHEHTRSDRDQYVKINWENIEKHNFINFRKMDTDNLNTPYDYTSVMHYGRTAFGRRAETITPIPNRSVAIGQRSGMSRIDILRINRLYRKTAVRGVVDASSCSLFITSDTKLEREATKDLQVLPATLDVGI
ncbi:unnamed protein product [Pleuronectes platessa]|uniref:Metalloendopeptidase n=1 Tax=Pleuronectes platessa TaxID=8262 RepID=A0A9N7UJE0_PLEPL|nr:unnamed protein product [Pleuronectes platessa]